MLFIIVCFFCKLCIKLFKMLKTFYLSVFLVKITQGISQRDKQDKKTELHLMQAKH